MARSQRIASAPSSPQRAPVMPILFSSPCRDEWVLAAVKAPVSWAFAWAAPGRTSDTPVSHVVVRAPAPGRVRVRSRVSSTPRSRLGAIGLLHELAVDRPGGFPFLGGAAKALFGLEELLIKLPDPAGELLIGEFGEHTFGEELVGDEVSALGLGETVLEGPELSGEAVVLGAGVLQLGTKRCAGHPRRGDQVTSVASGGL